MSTTLMKRTAVIILVVLGALSLGAYLFIRGRSASDIEGQVQADITYPDDAAPRKMVTDDFEIGLPEGWRQTAPAMGASVMAINTEEQLTDPAAQAINFRSYFAVSHDTLQEKDLDAYVETVKAGLEQAIPDVEFTEEHGATLSDMDARGMEAELTQQDVAFKVLMMIVRGQDDDIWILSFNTTADAWKDYEDTFYAAAETFKLKK